MDERIPPVLQDILEAISHIELFCCAHGKEYGLFYNDICFRSAVQWEIVVIGEAMNRILKIYPDVPISLARRIVDTRNFLIHGYDSLRPDLVWAIVINHLPKLKAEVEELLKN